MPFLGDRATYGRTIKKENGYDANSYTYFPVLIIGAGESGIAMGCRLKEVLGFDQFRIFDRQSGIGGTWWINRYPGVACDIPAPFYSFSFCPNPNWTSMHPEGPEIVKYLQAVCDQYEIVDKIQLNTEIKSCRWLESEHVWEMTIRHLATGVGDLSAHDVARKIKEHGPQSVYIHEEVVRAKIVVSAVGGLVEPKVWPESIPGKDKFSGEIFHSARWRYDVDLKNKNVVVVGTGCSAAQFVPELTKQYGAKSVTQLMRTPPWVVPRVPAPLGEKNWSVWAPWLNKNIPGFMHFFRGVLFFTLEYDWRLFGSGDYHEKQRQVMQDFLLKHMRKTAPKKYHDMLTPNYSVGCKRRISDATWFPGLHDPAVELTTLPLTSIAEDSVTLGPRKHSDPKKAADADADKEVNVPADVIILANGFETTQWFHSLETIGRGGKSLHQVFEERGGPQMYMGTAMDGFPNFFTIFGPNTVTGHTSVIYASECMVNLSLKFIGPVLAGDVDVVEIKKEAEVEWARDTQQALKKRVWNTGGCTNWYQTKDGWNSNAYPYSQIWFGLYSMFPTWSDWQISYTPQGASRRRRKAFFRSLVFLALFSGALRLSWTGNNWRSLRPTVQGYIRNALLVAAGALQTVGGAI